MRATESNPPKPLHSKYLFLQGFLQQPRPPGGGAVHIPCAADATTNPSSSSVHVGELTRVSALMPCWGGSTAVPVGAALGAAVAIFGAVGALGSSLDLVVRCPEQRTIPWVSGGTGRSGGVRVIVRDGLAKESPVREYLNNQSPK
jgi:hypothetical protein